MTNELTISEESTNLATGIMGLKVTNSFEFDLSATYAVDLQKMKKVMKAYHKPLKEATHAAHKAATTREKDDLAPLEDADRHLRKIRSDYVAKEKEKQRKAQAKKDEAAEKRAEKEREKIRKKAEAEEDPEKKQELEEKVEEVYVEPVMVETKIEKSEGISWVEDIEVTVTDIQDLLRQVAIGKIPITVVEVKAGMLKRWAKTNAVINGQFPGIHIKKTKTERVRTG